MSPVHVGERLRQLRLVSGLSVRCMSSGLAMRSRLS